MQLLREGAGGAAGGAGDRLVHLLQREHPRPPRPPGLRQADHGQHLQRHHLGAIRLRGGACERVPPAELFAGAGEQEEGGADRDKLRGEELRAQGDGERRELHELFVVH